MCRRLNHSCDPNMRIVRRGDGNDVESVQFVARRMIEGGEELTFDYGKGVLVAKNGVSDVLSI